MASKEPKVPKVKRCVVKATACLTPEEFKLEKTRVRCRNLVREDQRVLGEKPYVAYFMELALEEISPNIMVIPGERWEFDVTSHDKLLFIELSNAKRLILSYNVDLEMYSAEIYI